MIWVVSYEDPTACQIHHLVGVWQHRSHLTAEGLLSNTRFIETYLHHRRQKGYGPLRIQAELTARGIPDEMIEHHLNMADNAWFTHARSVWQKRFKGILPRDFKARAQQMRFLQYRGFTAAQINNIIDNSDS